MFVRTKPSGAHKYLQVVESFREGRKVRQRVVATLGRLDRLQAEGNIDGIVKSLARFAIKVRLVEGHKSGRLRAGAVAKIGPAMVVERIWRELGIGRVIEGELRGRKFGFPVERAVFLTVLHRLFAQGSDRAADKCLPGVRQGSATMASRARTNFRCIISIAPWRGWAKNCPKRSRTARRPSPRVA